MSANLSSALFYLLLFLFLYSTLCGQVWAEKVEQRSGNKVIGLFDKNKITDAKEPNEKQLKTQLIEVIVKDYYSPVFLSTSNFLVALAGINRTEKDKENKNITVFTNYFVTKSNEDWGEKLFTTDSGDGGWKEQLVAYDKCEGGCDGDGTSVVRGLAAAAKDSKIYLLLVNASSTSGDDTNPVLNFWLVVGTVETGSSENIKWDKGKQLTFSGDQPKVTQLIKEQRLSDIEFFGSSVVTNEKQIIFLLRIQTKSSKKTVFAFFKLEETIGSAENVKFLPSEKVDQDCYPYVFLWESKIIVIPTQCTGGVSNQKIKEITDFAKAKEWTDSSGPFHLFVGFFNDKSDFMTANINNSEVLLFTQKIPKSQSSGNNDVYLWVTDGNHSYRAKEPFTDVSTAPISLFYKDNELLALYQKWEQTNPQNKPNKIILRQLKTQLSDITFVIGEWGKVSETIKKVCSGKISCAPQLSTAGLVGFLSDNKEEANKIWKDEYYYVNAAIKSKEGNNNKVEKVTDGFKFIGEVVGAQWEVGKKQEEQPYNFTDPGFTLFATVEIGNNNNEKTFDNSLLGLILKDDKHIGLLCSGGNWAVGDNNNFMKKSAEKCEQEETYFVGLVLEKGGNLAIYVDGKKLNELDDQALKIEEGKNIAHFYFGTDEDTQKLAKTDVAITNVLLYNRPFKEDEIKNVKAQKREKPKPPTPPINGTINTQEDGKNTSETDRPSSTSATEKDGAEIKLCSPLKNEFTVFALLLLVWFTLLARYA